MLVVGGASASAQTAILQPTTTITRTAKLAPLASASFAPASFGGTFNGSPLTIGLAWVSVTSGPGQPVYLGQNKDSGILVQTPQGIANGNYSVELLVPWANQAATLSFVRGNTEIAQCPIQQQSSYAAGSLIQRCDSGLIAVSDGSLNVTIQIKNPNPTCSVCISSQQLSVSQVTINLWR
jgi:hypothetical protein